MLNPNVGGDPSLAESCFALENVWQAVTPEQEEEVLAFWEESGLLEQGPDQLRQRAQQVVLIARDLERRVMGVCTAYKSFARSLNNHVYVYRTMVSPGSRRTGIAISMLKTTRDFFNSRYRDKIDTDCIGLMFTLENPDIGAAVRQAVWPRTGFVFLGYNQRQQQRRIFYFDNAVI